MKLQNLSLSQAGIFLVAITILFGISSSVSVAQSTDSDKTKPFPEPQDTQPAPEGFTSAKGALAAIRLPPGFRATLFASEPAIRQPIGLATDPRGRLWVAENYS